MQPFLTVFHPQKGHHTIAVLTGIRIVVQLSKIFWLEATILRATFLRSCSHPDHCWEMGHGIPHSAQLTTDRMPLLVCGCSYAAVLNLNLSISTHHWSPKCSPMEGCLYPSQALSFLLFCFPVEKMSKTVRLLLILIFIFSFQYTFNKDKAGLEGGIKQ